jgi:hypothetical protein
MVNMKKIILASLILGSLFSCKSSKNADCDAYGKTETPKSHPLDYDYVMIDTLYLEEEHLHIEEESLCFWFPAEKYIIIDTFKVRVWVK